MLNPSAMDIPPVPNQPKTNKFPQRCFGKTNPVKRNFQASDLTVTLNFEESANFDATA